jgi:hypothetical protein
MPLPKRNKDEDKDKFVSRCISSEVMKKEYPSNAQRVAVCIDQATADCSCVESADFRMQIEVYGYEEELDENNFYIPAEAEYEDFGEETEEWDIAGEKPGLWENIRKKKEREGKNYKPAKKGDKDRPDPEAWKKAQNEETDAKYEYQDPHTGEVYTYRRKGYYERDGRILMYMGEAEEYQGRKVTLNKPFRTPDGPKKFSVYVKNDRGNVVKVNFGDPNMEIKKDIPARRKSFRARMRCDNPGPKYKARYWACKSW